jgi:ribosomal 50S subunit-recycling heat shock protein
MLPAAGIGGSTPMAAGCRGGSLPEQVPPTSRHAGRKYFRQMAPGKSIPSPACRCRETLGFKNTFAPCPSKGYRHGSMRLNRYLASAGLGSRRGVEELIKAGRVRINGRVVTDLATQVGPEDSVKVGNRVVHVEHSIHACSTNRRASSAPRVTSTAGARSLTSCHEAGLAYFTSAASTAKARDFSS